VIEHLLVSTAILAVAMAAARFLPLTARTRYAVLLCGVAKFAVPTAVFRFVPATAVPAPLRILGGGAAGVAAPSSSSIHWIPIVWATIALLLLGRWLLLRTRTIATALREPAAVSARELAAVRDGRATMRIDVAVDAIRSAICEAPAVLRIVRPVIVLPAHGCDELSDDELRSLVLHECAHVARRDNLAAVLQMLAASLLWFHPLVWLASRALAVAREEACDEAVADAMHGTDAYVSALTKICHAIVAPRTAGASCMASTKMKERMEHLMSYQTIKGKAWSHRAMLALGAGMIALSTLAATATSQTQAEKYRLAYTVDPIGNQLTFNVTVTNQMTGEVVAHPRLTTRAGVRGRMEPGNEVGPAGSPRIQITVDPRIDGSGTITLDVFENETLVQHSEESYAPGAAPRRYTGEPVSINLKDADLRDVLATFGQLTGHTIDMASDVTASVTVNVVNVPWDRVLDDILNRHGLVAEIDGKTIHVTKKKE
jgi:beta-lactamase regulating signal transducer with metallopeptidase domain